MANSMSGAVDLAATIRDSLRALADPQRAPRQQAYMKSALPFLGVSVPVVRRATAAAARGVRDDALLRAVALELWDNAGHREEWYAAMSLLGRAATRGKREVVPLVEHMVRTGAWWDVTDELAHRMAEQLDVRPAETAHLLRQWARDRHVWMRRIAIIAQLGRKAAVDRALLIDVIEANSADPDFFIRKAIGWALREYARIDPAWVRGFAFDHELSPLSVREALKHLRPV